MNFADHWRRTHQDQVWSMALECTLCRLKVQVQGGDFEAVHSALQAHWKTHPEWDEYLAHLPPISDLTGIWKKPRSRAGNRPS